MTSAQRRVTLAVCVIVALSLLVAAGIAFVVAPMAIDLGLPDEAVEDALVIPAIAALVVVFISGRAGDRLGYRRTMIVAGVIFSIGGAVLATARGELSVQAGLAISGVGAALTQVVALGLLQRTAPDGRAHVSAFTTYGMVFPLAFLVLPILTAGLVVVVDWRWVPVAWSLAGLAISATAMLLLERGAPTTESGEWGTPLLAGLSLAAGCISLAEVDNLEVEPLKIAAGAVACLVAGGACIALVRRSRDPGFSLRPIDGPVLRALLIGVGVISCVQLLTYVCIAMEYLYDLTALQVAIAIVPAQVGAVLGAKLVARLAIRLWGVSVAGRLLVLATGVSTLPLALTVASTPAWFLVAVSTVFSAAGMAALTVLNLDVMGMAPPDGTGAVSAFRTAASSIGSAAGMALLGTIVIASVEMDGGAANVAADQLDRLAAALRIDGVLGFAIAAACWLVLRTASRHSGVRRTGRAAA